MEPDKNHDDDFKRLVAVYWNNEKSQIVIAVQNTPVVGPHFYFLDDLPGDSGQFLATLVLLAILSYGAYKLYLALVVSMVSRSTNRTKLKMEIDKLFYEIEVLKKDLGVTVAGDMKEEALLSMHLQHENLRESILNVLKLPEANLLHFFKHKVLRMFTEEEERHRAEKWKEKLQAHNKNKRLLLYYGWLLINLLATIFMGALSMVFLIDIFLPFIEPENIDGLGYKSSFVFIVLFAASFSVLMNLNSRRRIVRKAYSEI